MTWRTITAVLPLALTVCLVAACDNGDDRTLLGPDDLATAISDGAHAGNPYFHLLPPLVPDPGDLATFDPNLTPRVEVCLMGDTDCTPLHVFEFEAMTVEPDHYHLNWNTGTHAVEVGPTYRLSVWVGTTQLGYADLVFGDNGSAKNQNTGDAITLVDGRTLPVRFHVEDGTPWWAPWCDATESDCIVAVVPYTGDYLLVTPDGWAGVEFPDAAWYDPEKVDGAEAVAVTIRRRDLTGDETCHDLPNTLISWEGCYEFRTDPYVDGFTADVEVGVCYEDDYLDSDGQLLSQHDDGTWDLLDHSPAAFLNCTGFVAFEPTTMMGRLARGIREAGWEPLAGLFMPAPLRATHLGTGGTVRAGDVGFSHIGWVLPVEIEAVAGFEPPQAAVAGAEWEVRVSAYTLHRNTPEALEVPTDLVFTTWDANGSETANESVPVLDGEAVFTWPFALPAGAHRLRVSGPVLHDLEFEVQVQEGVVIDGVEALGEWEGLTVECRPFSVTPADGSEPAAGKMCATHDADNLYLLLTAEMATTSARVGVQFDADWDGGTNNYYNLVPRPGDDVIILRTTDHAPVALDNFYGPTSDYDCPDPAATVCLVDDVEGGGYQNSDGAMTAGPDRVIAEFAHPYNSGDERDVNVGTYGEVLMQGRFIFGDHWSHADLWEYGFPDPPA